ncbi:MAG: sugar transferase [Deltaproteobacteria bacterium]|nr:sugar transferase [Deltaproteobacteria bacterium]
MYKLFSLHISKWKLVLLAGDFVAYCLSAALGLYGTPKLGPEIGEFASQHIAAFLLVGLTYVLVLYIADTYDYQQDFRRWSNIARLILSGLLGALVVIVLFYFPLGAFIGRTLLIIQASAFIGLLLIWRCSFSALALPQQLQRQVLIIGAGSCGRRILEAIRHRPRGGLTAIGFIDDDPGKLGAEIEGLPVLGNSAQMPEIVHRHQANLVVVVAVTHQKSPSLITAVNKISWNGCQLMDMPSLYEFLAGKVPIEHISDTWFYLTSMQANKVYYRHLKRLLDLGLAILSLASTWPVFLLIALAVKLDSRGPVFFRQERLGQDGKPFQIIKFRTMIEGAERFGPQWACAEDSRITRVGRVLRKMRLDELPQLLNILRGDMSFIGPRPERQVFIQEFQELVPDLRPGRRAGDAAGAMVQCGYKEKIPYYSYRLLVKPGLSGWAQVMYPYTSSLEQTREKLKYDLYYIKNMGFFLDLAILLKTIRIVLFGRGT